MGALLALAAVAAPAGAYALMRSGTATADRFPPYLQCVPYARRVTGIAIFGDAYTWWGQAAGRYARGSVPRVGAVMSFRAGGGSRLGHVAAVSGIVDSRTVLISHANWSPINGRRGQIERNVRAVDVSPNNDWSQVRVWFAPIHALGGKRWALNGFIYNQRPGWNPGRPMDREPIDIGDSRDEPEFVQAPKKTKTTRSFAATVKALVVGAPATPKQPRIGYDFGPDLIGDIIAKKQAPGRKR